LCSRRERLRPDTSRESSFIAMRVSAAWPGPGRG
jgi:hypothetical protein